MHQYLETLTEVLEKGTWKPAARENMPRTISRFGILKRFNLQEGFPLVTTKETYWKGVVHELIWFLRGDTNINYLHKNKVIKMWHEDAYKFYKANLAKNDTYVREFDDWKLQLDNEEYALQFGSLGRIYSYQWRNFTSVDENGKVYHFDQIDKLISRLRISPEDRYKVVTAWNPSEINQCALPPCHMLFQFNCRPMTIDERFAYLI